jgi:hypothetical protein
MNLDYMLLKIDHTRFSYWKPGSVEILDVSHS